MNIIYKIGFLFILIFLTGCAPLKHQDFIIMQEDELNIIMDKIITYYIDNHIGNKHSLLMINKHITGNENLKYPQSLDDFGYFYGLGKEEFKETEKYIHEFQNNTSFSLKKLFHASTTVNKKTHELTLSSNPKHGYLVDDKNNYIKLFEESRRDIYEKYNIRGVLSTNMPVLDQENGVILIFINHLDINYMNKSWFLFRYSNNTFEEITQTNFVRIHSDFPISIWK